VAVAGSWRGVRQLLGIICSTVGASRALTVVCSKFRGQEHEENYLFFALFLKVSFYETEFSLCVCRSSVEE
jgi:hypothetical protein